MDFDTATKVFKAVEERSDTWGVTLESSVGEVDFDRRVPRQRVVLVDGGQDWPSHDDLKALIGIADEYGVRVDIREGLAVLS